VTAVLLLLVFELDRTLASDLARQLDDRLEQQAQAAAQWVSEGRRHPDKLAGRLGLIVHAQVTIFDREGAVLGDSEVVDLTQAAADADDAALDGARRGEVGKSTRVVAGTPVRFVAVPAADGMVLRLGAPLSDIDATLGALRRRLAVAFGLGIGAALALGWLASQLASRPLRAMTLNAARIARGDYAIEPSRSPDEFGALSRTLASLASQVDRQLGELTSERDRLSAILAGMVEGVLVLDRDRRVVLANPAAESILDGASLVGEPLANAVADARLRAVIEAAAEKGETSEVEVETERRAVALYVRPLATAGGGVVTVLRDLTRLRKLLVMRRDFVANMSHELRTPVTAIQGYAETLLRGKRDEATQREFLEIVHRHARRLGALVEGLLVLSDLEARPAESAAREPVDLAAVARNVRATLRDRAAQLEASVEVEVPEGLVARGDPVGVEQIVENLVDNAIKYGRERGGCVRIAGEACDDGARVAIVVTDDGPGIAAEHLPRLFERFYRVDPGRSRERGGTGLGLAIVKHVAEGMGGRVEVKSATGAGTTFRVELAAWSDAPPARAPASTSAIPSAPSTARRSSPG
jgi:two-component system phosphate regulon sensor histidine kinase PhoR